MDCLQAGGLIKPDAPKVWIWVDPPGEFYKDSMTQIRKKHDNVA